MTTRMVRLLQIYETINHNRYPSVQDLCRMFEVAERTILQDIQCLKEEAGLKIIFDRVKNGYYNAEPNKRLPEFKLTERELFALVLGKKMVSQYTGISFAPVLRSAIEKIEQCLPEKVKQSTANLVAVVQFDGIGVIPISRTMFLELNEACAGQKRAHFTYRSASKNEVTERLVDPHLLVENRDIWYLVAWCHLRNDKRLFALHRIKDYRVSNESYTSKSKTGIEEWMKGKFLLEERGGLSQVKIQFGPVSARYIRERLWHKQQKLTEHKDGTCSLEFSTLSLDETKRWILQYGADAKVLEPLKLRAMVAAELYQAAKQYACLQRQE